MPAKPGRAGPLSGYTIEEAAYHEAGHAVLALACQAIRSTGDDQASREPSRSGNF
jgi:hypothetical protein